MSVMQHMWANMKRIKFQLQIVISFEHLLRTQCECRTCDAGGQVQPFNYLLPQLLVYDVDETAARDHQIVQLVKIQHRFGHDRKSIDRRSWKSKRADDLVDIQVIVLIFASTDDKEIRLGEQKCFPDQNAPHDINLVVTP